MVSNHDKRDKIAQEESNLGIGGIAQGKKVIRCKWIYWKKEAITVNEWEKFKARLVAKGYSHKEGKDYNTIFSPVVKHTSIQVILSIVAMFNLELEQLDMNKTFLLSELEEQIYISSQKDSKNQGKNDWCADWWSPCKV